MIHHTGGYMKDEGFTILEVLISLSLMIVFSMTIFLFFKSVNVGLAAAVSDFKKSYVILRADDAFRQKVRQVDVPYWDDPEKYLDALSGELAAVDTHGVIQSIKPVRRMGVVSGVVVVCMYENQSFEVLESFNSSSIAGMYNE